MILIEEKKKSEDSVYNKTNEKRNKKTDTSK